MMIRDGTRGGIMDNLKTVCRDVFRLLTFQSFKLDTSILNWYLGFGLVVTWLCGIGRYWDNPKAYLWQYLGLGSVVYVFVLAAILWVIITPLKPANWTYRNILTFVSLTSPPALLYAIPVERFMSLPSAQAINAWFLGVVALWRVALLFGFLNEVARLPWAVVFVAAMLPLTLIVTVLTGLNLEHVVFEIMAGIREADKSQNDSAYGVLLVITTVSLLASPLLLLAYIVQVYKRRRLAT